MSTKEKSLEEFVYEVIKMNFRKLGKEILNPNNWETTDEETQKQNYERAWLIICEAHCSLFNLMTSIDCFKELERYKQKEKESK